MSAWVELVNAAGSDEWLEKCSVALEEVQRETLCRAARKIRAHDVETVSADAREIFGLAADLIDPDKT